MKPTKSDLVALKHGKQSLKERKHQEGADTELLLLAVCLLEKEAALGRPEA